MGERSGSLHDTTRRRHRGLAAGLALVVIVLAVVAWILYDGTRVHSHWVYAGSDLAAGRPVEEYRGPEHCGWNDTTFLQWHRLTFVRDVGGRFDTATTFAPNVALPASAVDTGWRDGDRTLWVSASGDEPPEAAFVVTPSGAERWPLFTYGCA